jgi:hypothetical protein
MQALRLIEDSDLEASELKDLVASDKIPLGQLLRRETQFTPQETVAMQALMSIEDFIIVAKGIRPGLAKGYGVLICSGEVLVEFYVSTTIAVLAPLNCHDHPKGE